MLSSAAWIEAAQLALDLGGLPVALSAAHDLAGPFAQRGQREAALILVTYVHTHPASEHATCSSAEQLCATLAAQLTPQQIVALEAYVHGCPFEEHLAELCYSTAGYSV